MAADRAKPIECSAQPMGLSFHPARRIVAAGLVDGTVELHNFSGWPEKSARSTASTEEDDTIFASLPVHTKDKPKSSPTAAKSSNEKFQQVKTGRSRGPSCRAVLFSNDGARLYSAGNGGGLSALDAETLCASSSLLFEEDGGSNSIRGEVWNVSGASQNGINVLYQLPDESPAGSLLATGDDEGVVRLWDDRISGGVEPASAAYAGVADSRGCVLSWQAQLDYVSSIVCNKDGNTLLAGSADGTLGVYDIRKSAVRKAKPAKAPDPRVSDNQDDELLSIAIMKNGKKVVCGTGEGVLNIWSWGVWGDISDRFPGHPNSIDALLKVDEDTVLTGSSDGVVRIVNIMPDKLLGILGDHEGFPVETLQWSSNREYVGSLSHDALIRMWDASLLFDEDDGKDSGEESDGKGVVKGNKSESAVSARAAAESDDEWDDESDDSDSDDSNEDNRGGKKPRHIKTDAEQFFGDL